MEGCCPKPKLLDLIPSEREWLVVKEEGAENNGGGGGSSIVSSYHKLELRLGPPGGEEQHYWSSSSHLNREEKGSVWFNQQEKGKVGSSIFQSPAQRLPPAVVMGKESSQPCYTKVVPDLHQKTSTQKRNAPGPVVGWPPIRSFRKNLASSSSSKPAVPETQNGDPDKNVSCENPAETSNRKGLFKKINMDGIPIGRKVDLNAHDSYEKLASAVDELFKGLLAAQRDSCAGGIKNKEVEEKAITGLLDGSGEYTLVYEDNEGDRMLVGDVPWHMFVSTVKRLRVLKSSEVSALSLSGCKARVQ